MFFVLFEKKSHDIIAHYRKKAFELFHILNVSYLRSTYAHKAGISRPPTWEHHNIFGNSQESSKSRTRPISPTPKTKLHPITSLQNRKHGIDVEHIYLLEGLILI